MVTAFKLISNYKGVLYMKATGIVRRIDYYVIIGQKVKPLV